jgi:hypothetical protein
MSYRDMTYCAGDDCSKFVGCGRALTQDVREKAKAAGMLVSQVVDPKAMPCYEEHKIRRYCREIGEEEVMFADGFDDALIGTARRISGTLVAVYDREKCLEILSRDMSPEDAEEYFSFNVEGAWVGEGTPIFIQTDGYEL